MPAVNVKIPVAVLPFQNNQLPGPMNEQDVPLEKPALKKKRSKSGNIETFRTSLFTLPTQAPSGFEGEVEYPTGRGYEGPFVDDKKMPTGQGQYGPEKALFRIPDNRQINIKPAEDTWLSKAISPSQDELDAEANGLRWHWALEHRFMPPGSRWNETVWNGVDRENAWLAQLLKQKAVESGQGLTMSPIAKQRELSRISGQYDKLVAEYLKGNWDDPERAYKDFLTEAERLRKQYAEQGGAYDDLRLPPPVAGGRSSFTTQSRPLKLREQYNFAKSVNEELASWLEPDAATGKRKIDDPKFVESKKMYLDSVYERLLKHIKDSSNTMADAEKQRLQILVLPDNAMDEVVQEVKAFQQALTGIMSSASAKDWSQNNKGKVNEVIKAMGFDASKDKATLGNQLATLGGIIVASLARNNELPHDVAAALEAAKTQFDTYMKNMMLSASVAPHLVANISSILANTIVPAYNEQAFVSDRGKADYLHPIDDISNQIPTDAMPISKLIQHNKYVWPSLNTVTDGKISTQAESEGETNPADPYANVPGISSTIDYNRYK